MRMPKEIVMRHRTPQFGHIFSGDGYSAGYYSYLWSDTLTADAAEAFEQAPGGYYDKAHRQKLRDEIFAVGDTMDPAEAFRRFRGRDVGHRGADAQARISRAAIRAGYAIRRGLIGGAGPLTLPPAPAYSNQKEGAIMATVSIHPSVDGGVTARLAKFRRRHAHLPLLDSRR